MMIKTGKSQFRFIYLFAILSALSFSRCTNSIDLDKSFNDTTLLPKSEWAEWIKNANFKDSIILMKLDLPINAKYYIHSGVNTKFTYTETDSLSKMLDSTQLKVDNIEHYYLWQIKNYQNGVYDIDVTIKRIIQKKFGGKWNIYFDSDRTQSNTENINVGMYKPFYIAMINKTFSMQITDRGVVKNVSGLSNVLNNATDSLLASVPEALKNQALAISKNYIDKKWQEIIYEFYFLYLNNKRIKINSQYTDTIVSQYQPKEIIIDFNLHDIKTDTLYFTASGFVQGSNIKPKNIANTDSLSFTVDAYSKLPIQLMCWQKAILSKEYTDKTKLKSVTADLTVETKRVK